MKETLARIWPLLVGIFLMTNASSLLGIVIALRAKSEGFSTATIGLIMAAFYIGYSVGAKFVPALIRNVGYIRVFAALMSVVSVAALAFPIYISSITWLIARTLLGFCLAGLYLVAESWLNSQSTNRNRAQTLGIYSISLFAGMALGAQLVLLVGFDTFLSFVFASIIFSVGAIPMLLVNIKVPIAPKKKHSIKIRELYEYSPLGTFAVFISNMVRAIMLSLAPVYGQQAGMSMTTISLFVSLNIFACIFTQLPIGKLSDNMDRRYVIIPVTFISACLSLYATTQTTDMGHILVFAILGGITLPQYALAVAYINDRLDSDEILNASGAIILVSGIGATIGPLVTGILMDIGGKDCFFYAIAIASFSVTLFAIYRMIRRPDSATSDENFNPIGLNAHTFISTNQDTKPK